MSHFDAIVLSEALEDRLVSKIRERLPRKSFGYIIATNKQQPPSDFILFEDNIRNRVDWKGEFVKYGQYFVDHDDAGFVAAPEESWRVQKMIWSRGLKGVGVFHSHLRHPANFSYIDYNMHLQGFAGLWHLVISMRNQALPQLRAYAPSCDGVRELCILREAPTEPPREAEALPFTASRDTAIRQARRILTLDLKGQPLFKNSRAIYLAVEALLRAGDDSVIDELLVHGFLRGSAERYQHIAHYLRFLDGGSFTMGTNRAEARHFCGETPTHPVMLSPFQISATPVTNELFELFGNRRHERPKKDRYKPVVEVSWFDAAVFALWVNCRLPTEAEWEFACGAGSTSDWCCREERYLARHAWYSGNSGGESHRVATRDPNALGLFDLHGNVWEWCRDCYSQDFYSRALRQDPINVVNTDHHKVCRGGSFHALSEMCRTRYRFHEPPDFLAADLGFRLAAEASLSASKGG